MLTASSAVRAAGTLPRYPSSLLIPLLSFDTTILGAQRRRSEMKKYPRRVLFAIPIITVVIILFIYFKTPCALYGWLSCVEV